MDDSHRTWCQLVSLASGALSHFLQTCPVPGHIPTQALLFGVTYLYLPCTISCALPLSCDHHATPENEDLNYTALLKTLSYRMKFKFRSMAHTAFPRLVTACLSRQFLYRSLFPSSLPSPTLQPHGRFSPFPNTVCSFMSACLVICCACCLEYISHLFPSGKIPLIIQSPDQSSFPS